jgi:hypothetical protein
MSWLNIKRDAIDWRCVYCGTEGELPHHASFRFRDFSYHLHRCPGCQSLIYDPAAMGPLFGLRPGDAEMRIGAKYYFEVAYSAYFTAHCAISTIPDISLAELKAYNFLDIGAGNGLGSYLVRELFGMEVFPVEPSLTGEYAREMFGLPVERRYFEDIDDAIIDKLKSKPCLVHLDSVIEHLNDPRALLKNLTASLDIEVLSGLVPDGQTISKDDPFSTSAPFLAPSDHVHLPSAEGMDKLFADLGFPYRHVIRTTKVMTVIGSKKPITPPSEQRTTLVTNLLLERLAEHPNPIISGGAVSRMLIDAIGNRSHDRIKYLSDALLKDFDPVTLLAKIRQNKPWNDIPFYCGNIAYWIAVEAFFQGRYADALPYLDLTEAFAERISADYPQYAMEPMLYKWQSRIFRAQVLSVIGRPKDATSVLRSIVAEPADAFAAPSREVVAQARDALKTYADALAA